VDVTVKVELAALTSRRRRSDSRREARRARARGREALRRDLLEDSNRRIETWLTSLGHLARDRRFLAADTEGEQRSSSHPGGSVTTPPTSRSRARRRCRGTNRRESSGPGAVRRYQASSKHAQPGPGLREGWYALRRVQPAVVKHRPGSCRTCRRGSPVRPRLVVTRDRHDGRRSDPQGPLGPRRRDPARCYASEGRSFVPAAVRADARNCRSLPESRLSGGRRQLRYGPHTDRHARRHFEIRRPACPRRSRHHRRQRPDERHDHPARDAAPARRRGEPGGARRGQRRLSALGLSGAWGRGPRGTRVTTRDIV